MCVITAGDETSSASDCMGVANGTDSKTHMERVPSGVARNWEKGVLEWVQSPQNILSGSHTHLLKSCAYIIISTIKYMYIHVHVTKVYTFTLHSRKLS